MEPQEQEGRIDKKQKRISNYNVLHWAEDFISGLSSIKKRQLNSQEKAVELLSELRRIGYGIRNYAASLIKSKIIVDLGIKRRS